MPLRFARRWNYDYNRDCPIYVNGAPFGVDDARAVLRAAVLLNEGSGLRAWIDNHDARVISGPHRSDDNRMHMTVLCKTIKGGSACFHVYISAKGNVSGVSGANTTKKGHAQDDRYAPVIHNAGAL